MNRRPLTPREREAYEKIAEAAELNVADLARRLGLRVPVGGSRWARELVDRLEDKGWIECERGRGRAGSKLRPVA